jgi:hypothetical protein
MGERGGADEIGMMGDENEDGEMSCERVFTVGEVVEFWEGAFVCGKRSDSGSPAFVKRVEGNGLYAIKMVGSCRGKFRICGWESLFKDGSFNIREYVRLALHSRSPVDRRTPRRSAVVTW